MTQPENKQIDDLEYLSNLGYEALPQAKADITELKQKIRSKYSGSSTGMNYFFTLMIGITLGVTLFFTMYNSPTIFPSRFETSVSNENKPVITKLIELDTVNIAGTKKTSEHPVHEKFIEPLETEVTNEIAESLEPINNKSIETENKENATLKYAPNASIIYLHDLKIANYQLNYFNVQKNILVPSGVPAIYAGKNEANSETKLDRNYYLHEVISDAMRAFKKQNYKGCISLLNTVSEFSDNDINCLFYKGMCFYYLQNYKEAYSNFKLAQANPVNVFAEETDFYLALSGLKTGQNEESVKALKEIAANNGFYSQKAKDLITNP